MAEITIIIPNYKGINFIEDCLTSVYDQEKDTPAYEVLVVDNASGDGSVELIREKFPDTRLICLEENTGFCHAVNVGIRESKSPFVLLLNNDTKVYPDFVKKLYVSVTGENLPVGERQKADRIFSVSAAMLMWDRPELMDDAGDQYNLLGWARARGKGQPYDRFQKRVKVFSACGGAAIYRRKILEEIGFFDERHFAYLEDLDLGFRARIRGYQNYYEPGARVIHYGSASTGSRYNEWKTGRAAANNVYVIYKNLPLLQKLLNLPFLVAGFFIKYLFFVRKRMGGVYLRGLADGLKMSFSPEGKKQKVRFRMRHFWNYVKIQGWLIRCIFMKY
ncbi:MAG: glycosyltransferase family 2 protein [Lachnospiraceae bacterium]|nr:glycosyltransferase family 2 protein [Lachnospiraceae bacterium]